MAFTIENSRSPQESVRVEDEGRVAYAYFVGEDGVDGMVWLYNVAAPPETLQEQTRGEAPLNPAAYVRCAEFRPPESSDQIGFNWLFREGVWECGIYIDGKLHAVVGKGDNPGWCVLAAEDGPLAYTLEL